jgi:hypothetical protein
MQASGDLALGWLRGPLGRDFYIRQLRDMKYQPDLSRLKLSGFETLAGLCGMTLARAHARSGRSSMIAAYLGQSPRFAHGLMSFTEAYLDQVAEDFARFKGAIEQGELAASEGDILPPTFIANPWNGILIEGRQPPGTQPASR